MIKALSLLIGWLLDLLLGDPAWLPHPVVGFGKMIAFGEKRLNRGKHRKLKGALMSIFLIVLIFTITWFICNLLTSYLLLLTSILIFCCLAGTTLIREVRDVFLAVDVIPQNCQLKRFVRQPWRRWQRI